MPSSDPELRRQHARAHYWRHRKELLAKAEAYREEHRAELALRQWRYYQIHKDAILARRRARKTERNQ